MSPSAAFLSPADAARQLGVSAKALRLYEERGLLTPRRTQTGWRAYGPADLARAAEIAALRALGFSLTQIARALGGDASGLAPVLAAHQSALQSCLLDLSGAIGRVRELRNRLAMTRSSAMLDLTALGANEAIILCPANHSPPAFVAPHPGAPGYEAVATCLAPPDVRARTEGVIAFRPPAA